MDGGGPSSSEGGQPGRGLDIAVWLLVVAGLIGVAAAVACFLSNTSFELREITYEDESVDVELIPAPVPQTVPAEPASPTVGTAGDEGGGVASARWTRQPAPFFPERAARQGIEAGEVRLLCTALSSGAVDDCEVLDETPSGAGFAEAALASMSQARVLPRSSDGVAVDSRIRFTILFRVAPGF